MADTSDDEIDQEIEFSGVETLRIKPKLTHHNHKSIGEVSLVQGKPTLFLSLGLFRLF